MGASFSVPLGRRELEEAKDGADNRYRRSGVSGEERAAWEGEVPDGGIIARGEAQHIITQQEPRELLRMAYRARWQGAHGLAVLDLRTGEVRPDYWSHAMCADGCEDLITLCTFDPDVRQSLGVLPEDLLSEEELADLRKRSPAAEERLKVESVGMTFSEVEEYLQSRGVSYEGRYEETVLNVAEQCYDRDRWREEIREQLDAAYRHHGAVE